MNRPFAILLILSLVLGQCAPHSHAGTGVFEPDDHALRPHVHLHGHGSTHDDHHEHAGKGESTSPDDSLAPVAEHDSDAVYLLASAQPPMRTCGSLGFDVHAIDWCVVSNRIAVDTPVRLQLRTCNRPDRYAVCPIYLLTASLRL